MAVFLIFGAVEFLLLLPGGFVLAEGYGRCGVFWPPDSEEYMRLMRTCWVMSVMAAAVSAGWCRVVQYWCRALHRQGYVLPLVLILMPSLLVFSIDRVWIVMFWFVHAGWMALQQWVYEKSRIEESM